METPNRFTKSPAVVFSFTVETDSSNDSVSQQQDDFPLINNHFQTSDILSKVLQSQDEDTSLMAILEPDSTLAIKQNAEVIQQHLHLLFSDQKLCDLILKNDEKQYNIHSFILTMHSDKYKAVFLDPSNGPPTEINLIGASCKTIEKLLEYMYTFKIEIDDENVDEMLNVSHQLDMRMLTKKCVEHLRLFNINNVLKYLMISKRYNLEEMFSQYLDYAKTHFSHIYKQPEFRMLDVTDVHSLIGQGDDYSTTEQENVDFFTAAVEWTKSDSTRNVHLARLLEKISFLDLNPEQIAVIINMNEFILEIPDCVQVLRKAFRVHALLTCAEDIHQRSTLPQPSILEPYLFVIGGLQDSRHPYDHGHTVLRCTLGTQPMQWTEDCPLPAKRCGHCVVVINNCMYVLGGSIQEGDSLIPVPTRTVLRYNNIIRKWEKSAPMLYVRSEFAACEVDGNIYALGGEADDFSPTDSVERYSPESNSWTLSEAMPVARSSHSACSHKGLIYVIGGCVRDTLLSFVDVYNVSEKKWTSKNHFPLKICRGSLVNAEGCMLYIGGVSFEDDIILTSSEKIYEYDEENDEWKSVGNLAIPRHLGATAVLGTNIYVIGGFSTCTWTSSCRVSHLNISTRDFVNNIPDLPYSLMNMSAGISLQYTEF